MAILTSKSKKRWTCSHRPPHPGTFCSVGCRLIFGIYEAGCEPCQEYLADQAAIRVWEEETDGDTDK